jgi:hypothetical protein
VFCTAVSAPSKTLFVGRTTVLSIKVRQNGKAVKGIRIKINGPSLKLTTKPSNANGIVTARLQPKRPGILTLTPVAKKSCKNPRIGVTGVFTPPVTG